MRRSTIVVCSLLVLTLALLGCREDEQGRVLLYQKGTYLGAPDTPTSEETRDALRTRIGYQRQ